MVTYLQIALFILVGKSSNQYSRFGRIGRERSTSPIDATRTRRSYGGPYAPPYPLGHPHSIRACPPVESEIEGSVGTILDTH